MYLQRRVHIKFAIHVQHMYTCIYNMRATLIYAFSAWMLNIYHIYTYLQDIFNTYIHKFTVYVQYVYGVATISRLLKIMGLICKRTLYKRRYSAKEAYNFKEPANRRHPIHIFTAWNVRCATHIVIYVTRICTHLQCMCNTYMHLYSVECANMTRCVAHRTFHAVNM